MINFERIVEGLLFEQETQTNLPGFEEPLQKPSFATTNKPIQDFVSNTKELIGLKQKLKDFNIQQNTLISLSPTWYRILDESILLRFTISQASKPEFTNIFPYVDFLALIKETKKGKNIKFNIHSVDKETVEQVENDFLIDFSTRKTGTHPFFNYTPKSRLLKSEYGRIKQQIVSSRTIGKLTINNFAKNNFSIKRSIYEVVNLRQDSPKTQVVTDNKILNDLLLEPEHYVPGGTVPTKTMPIEVRSFADAFIDLSQKIKSLVQADSAANLKPLDYITKKTIKDLQTSSLTEAKDVLDSITSLANIIPKAPTKEWTSVVTGALAGLTQMAQGARLGTKMMGT